MCLLKWRWFVMAIKLLFLSLQISFTFGQIGCPPYNEIPYCSCFLLDDQLHVQCSGSDLQATKKSLEVLNGPVKSFSMYDLDSNVDFLPKGMTDNVTSPIFHLQLSHSSLANLEEGSLNGLSKSVESLAIISGRLKVIPQATLSALKRLKLLDLEGNLITELPPYSFHNLLIQKVNLKGNQIGNISEHAFWGLEETLMEIDLSENKLTTFPYGPLKRLRLLSTLNLAWNEITELSVLSKDDKISAEWPLLKYLNLNSNLIRRLERHSFSSMANLKSLSIHLNSIETVHESSFEALKVLETLDLSQNRIKSLEGRTFSSNTKLNTIDLSNNHLHLLSPELFNNLTELRELFLNGNNLLQLLSAPFLGANKISVLYLQGNALKFIESTAFAALRNLTELRLSDNFLKILPQELFLFNENLDSISLDGNLLERIEQGSFHNCKNLKELRLQNNELGEIPSGVLDVLPSIEEIHLENNKLESIRGLDSLRKIRHVSFSRNQIKRLTVDMLPGTELSSISFGHNSISWIADGTFKNQTTLQVLHLVDNQLQSLGSRTFEGLKNLERLYLQRNNLTWIEPDTFSGQTKALQFIDLSYNDLSSITSHFTTLPFIEEINLSYNKIEEIIPGTFANLRSLRILDLSHNLIHILDLSGPFSYSGIEILKISSNLISNLKSSQVQQQQQQTSQSLLNSQQLSKKEKNLLVINQMPLKELDLSDNLLTSAAIKGIELPQLEVLQISSNNFSDIEENTLRGFTKVNFLGLEKCSITSLPPGFFKFCPDLAVILLSDNGLGSLPDNLFLKQQGQGLGSRGLRELHLRSNRIRNFPYKTLWNISTLEILTLGGNRVGNIEFSKILLPRLKQLDLNDNRLGKITSPQGGLGKALGSIEVIDFGLNNISKVADDFLENVHLTQLNMGGNSFSKIPSAFSSKYISSDEDPSKGYLLNMSSNPLVDFYPENHGLQNYSVLDLYLVDTNVTYLSSDEFKIYPKLHRLVIRKNPISAIPLGAFFSLKFLNLLDLSENDILDLTSDSFSGLEMLKSLNLSNNRIKSLTGFHKDLQGLQDLDLSQNQLTRLMPEAFSELISLVSLRLRGNWLTALPADLFGPMARLSLLDLSHNYIENVPATLLTHLETRITTLRLEENPLDCSCENTEFWRWLQAHPRLLLSSAQSALMVGIGIGAGRGGFGPNSAKGQPNLLCERPDELRGRSMLSNDISTFCSSPTIIKVAIQDIQPSSAVVSWQGRNSSAMQGYVIAYKMALNQHDVVRTKQAPPSSRAYPLTDLQSDTPYLVCVLGLSPSDNATAAALTTRSAETLLKDSPVSKCAQVRTLVNSSGLSDLDTITQFLQRRLGVVVGAFVGIAFFLILIVTVACVKLRKRRTNRRQQINGKIDQSSAEPLTIVGGTNTLLGTYTHNNANNHQFYHHHHHHSLQHQKNRHNGNGANGGSNGGLNGTATLSHSGNSRNTGNSGNNGNSTPSGPGDLSPQFLTHTYRNYANMNNTEYGIAIANSSELERL